MTDPEPTLARLDPANDAPYSSFRWDRHRFGNHRIGLSVEADGPVVRAKVAWRRSDPEPEDAELLLVPEGGDEPIRNAVRLHVDRFSADILFEPVSGADTYYLYYLPYDSDPNAYYQRCTYRKRTETADREWAETALRLANECPTAKQLGYEAVADHHAFLATEEPAKPEEVQILLSRLGQPDFVVFPDRRELPIRMADFIPFSWTQRDNPEHTNAVVNPGEFFVFQLGVLAVKAQLDNVEVECFLNGTPLSGFRCWNLGGTDSEGKRLERSAVVEAGKVKAFWCGFTVDEDAALGDYDLTIRVSVGQAERWAKLHLTIEGTAVENYGDDDPYRLSRLRWLDSTLAADCTPVPPFGPVVVKQRTLVVLGRQIDLAANGLPGAIRTYYDDSSQIGIEPNEILQGPVRFFVRSGGNEWFFDGRTEAIDQPFEGRAVWSSQQTASGADFRLVGSLEYDGTMEYRLTCRFESDVEIEDMVLDVPIRAEIAQFAMGLGHKGGRLQGGLDWKWDVARNQDSIWLGNTKAGLQLSFRDDSYRRPLNTNFYHAFPLVMPRSWCNDGKGGVKVSEYGHVRASTGSRKVAAGEELVFVFRIAVTPFKPIDSTKHFLNRFCHAYRPVDEVLEEGANLINVHHATDINPYINYPFLSPAAMKAYVDEAHSKGCKVKIYYTVRELTSRAPETSALASLDNEVYSPGNGGGYSWLQEHVPTSYIPAWYAPNVEDSSIITTGKSRWHNFYIEGLDWLARNVGIDGLYLDDIAYDRTTMKRVRSVLAKRRPDPFIDIHSANQFNEKDGFASSANLYMEHFPFVDRLWLGEYFDYDSSPNYWLVEVSGIPFGLMGEMLEGGGNPWRGALFGMTCRLGWHDGPSPKPVWRIWDEFGIQNAEFLGWWSNACPIHTDHPDVLATVFRKKGTALLAVASWAKEDVQIRLEVDVQRLGFVPKSLHAPASDGFQEEAVFEMGDLIPVQPGKGWMFILK